MNPADIKLNKLLTMEFPFYSHLVEEVKLAIQAGADVHRVDKSGDTPVILLLKLWLKEVQKRTNSKYYSQEKISPQEIIQTGGIFAEALEVLLESGGDSNSLSTDLAFLTGEMGENVLSGGLSAAHLAVVNPFGLPLLLTLIKHGAELHYEELPVFSLFCLCLSNATHPYLAKEMMKCLIKAGANPNISGKGLLAPLCHVAYFSYADLVTEILALGADPTIAANDKEFCIEWLENNGFYEASLHIKQWVKNQKVNQKGSLFDE